MDLVELRRIVLPIRDVVMSLWRPINGKDAVLDANFGDLVDHVLRVQEWTESLRDMVSTIFETHLSLQDRRLNEVMRKLAGWAAVISLPTMITGFFGMNVPYPGFGQPWGFLLAAALVLVPAGIVYVIMRRLKWL